MKCLGQFLQHKQSSKTKCPSKTSLKNRGVNTRSIKSLPVNLEASVRVLREAVFVGRRTAAEVDSVGLRGEGGEGSRAGPDLFSVVGRAGTVDVEAGDDLRD